MSKLKFIILSLTILVLGLVAPACLKKPAVPPANQNQNTSASTTTSEIDTSDWKTYRNEEYGFEFKYPSQSDLYPTTPPHEVKFISNKLEIARSIVLTVFTFSEMDPVSYIKRVILKDADPNCIIKTLKDSEKFQKDYITYFILMIDATGTERIIPFTDDGINCTEYAGSGNTYFIYNRDVPNKLLHIAIYQDPSMSHYQITKFLKSIRIFN